MTKSFWTVSNTSWLNLICHFAFWFGLVFATPLFLVLHNVEGLTLRPTTAALWAGAACLLLSLSGWALTGIAGSAVRDFTARFLLASSVLLAIQGNGIHDLHGFGVFDGTPIDFRANKAIFWLDAIIWTALLAGLSWFFIHLARIPLWFPALPILSFCLLLAPALSDPPQSGFEISEKPPVEPAVFAFSSLANLVHLLPDGFQGDTVRLALQEDRQLASRFDGFTLFTDHLGRYPGTAPSLYTMLTGRPFPLDRGFSYSWVGPEIRADSYQAELARHGFRVDVVPISDYICPDNADSCHPLPFKNNGLLGQRIHGTGHSVRLLADLTLFRLAPLFLKEKIYDEGFWLLSDIGMDESSPVPDPVLREWTANMRIVHDRPVYKWYHYVGTHVPPRWDGSCDLRRDLDPTPENYRGQARCILEGIAEFLDRLKDEGIYEQTAIVISGDHGHNTVPVDQTSTPMNYGMYGPLLGTGRPALLVKNRDASGPLAFSEAPTDLLHIAPTARALSGLPPGGDTVFDIPEKIDAPRRFHHYPIAAFWSGNPVPYLEYQVGQPVNDASLWELADMVGYGNAPSEFDPVNKATAKGFMLGARLRSTIGKNRSSWVRGRQLAFLIDAGDDSFGGTLELELAFESWMNGQSASVRMNGVNVLERTSLLEGNGSGEWQTWQIPVPREKLRPGPDFVSIVFERLHRDSDGEAAAALLRSVRYLEP